MNWSRKIARTRVVSRQIKSFIEALETVTADGSPSRRQGSRLPKGLLDKELWVLGELTDVATALAADMRQRGVPEDDEELMKVEASRRRMAENAAWVLSEKAREAEEEAAWRRNSKAMRLRRIRAARLPKPDVREDPTTVH